MTRNIKIILGIMIVVTVVSLVALFRLNAKIVAMKTESMKEIQASQEVLSIVDQVNKHVVLPTDEVPSGAVVSDLSKLQGQPFFERAQNGDIVLIYATSRRVILWRPSTQKVVEISAINFPSAVGATPGTSAPGATNKK